MSPGFSLVEMTVAMAIILAFAGGIFAVMDRTHGPFSAQPALMDEQQRVRVAAEAITRELLNAGAGSGGLFAGVAPFRRGLTGPDPPGAFFDDRVSVISVPVSSPRTAVAVATDGGGAIYVEDIAGFVANSLAIVFDASGSCDIFRIGAVQAQPPALIMASGTLSRSYAPGAVVGRAVATTFWLRPDPSTGANQLVRYDGNVTDATVADELDAIGVTYFGVEPGGSPALVPFDAARFIDGPWRPDAIALNRFDEDLLRIRRVRVALRARGGRVFTFDVTPRNLELPP